MNEIMNQVLGSAQSAFFYGTALYALCYAGDGLLSKIADSRNVESSRAVQAVGAFEQSWYRR